MPYCTCTWSGSDHAGQVYPGNNLCKSMTMPWAGSSLGTAGTWVLRCPNKKLSLYGSRWVNYSPLAYLCKGLSSSKEKLSVTDTIISSKKVLLPSTAKWLSVPHTGTSYKLIYVSSACYSSGKSSNTDHLSYCLFFFLWGLQFLPVWQQNWWLLLNPFPH